MAKIEAVWGIDIGQCGIKALRCRTHEQSDRLTAEAFDYIEYPKLISQPEADGPGMIREALKQFLSRNSVRGDRVAISVPGQAGLARFIKLPPVESKKVPDIVKYEARQQIPFPLSEVVWDYQQMAGGSEEDGFVLETEVGLFAMKRDQVYRSLEPFSEASIEVDIVQLTPLCLYNYVAFDQLHKLPSADQYDPDNPPESIVVLSLGTETTDLVVTNGYRVWQRSIPLGGSHFTKALAKELKLTYPKAEHLKRNAAQAENPKAIFQAMRPVFNDLVTEVQRSIGYFTNIDRKAKIARIVTLGSAMKLPGLQRFLQQNLGLDIDRIEGFRGLSGSAVVEAPIFKENVLAFGVCYGLCVQGMRAGKIRTNLIPPEIVQDRMIRAKKPWAIAAAACLMIGMTASFGGHWGAWNSVRKDKFDPDVQTADAVAKTSTDLKTAYSAEIEEKTKTEQIGNVLVSNIEGRLLWLEVLKAINGALPFDEKPVEDVHQKNEVHILSIQCQKVTDLAVWWAEYGVWKPKQEGEEPVVAAKPPADANAAPPADANAVPPADAKAAPPADPSAAADPNAAPPAGGPAGEGWVFKILGYHYHNRVEDRPLIAAEYVRRTFIDNLERDFDLPAVGMKERETLSAKDLGIGYAVLFNPGEILPQFVLDEDAIAEMEKAAAPGAAKPKPAVPPRLQPGQNNELWTKELQRFDFELQFCWQEKPAKKREEERNNKPAAAQAAPEQAVP